MREVTIPQWFEPGRFELSADNTPVQLMHGPLRGEWQRRPRGTRQVLLYPVTTAMPPQTLRNWQILEQVCEELPCLSRVEHVPSSGQTLLPAMLCRQTGELFTPPCPGCGDDLHWIPDALAELVDSREDSLYCPHCFNSGESEDWRVFVAGERQASNEREVSLFDMWRARDASRSKLPCGRCEHAASCYQQSEVFSHSLALVLNNAQALYIVSLAGTSLSAWQQEMNEIVQQNDTTPPEQLLHGFRARLSVYRQWLAALDALQDSGIRPQLDDSNLAVEIVADDLMGDDATRSRLCWFPMSVRESAVPTETCRFVFSDIRESENQVQVSGHILARIPAPALSVTLGVTEGFHEPLTLHCQLQATEDDGQTNFVAILEGLPQQSVTSLNVLRHIPELQLTAKVESAGEGNAPELAVSALSLRALLMVFESGDSDAVTSALTARVSESALTAEQVYDAVHLQQLLGESLLQQLPFLNELFAHVPELASAWMHYLTQILSADQFDSSTGLLEHLVTEAEVLWDELHQFAINGGDQNEPVAAPVTFHPPRTAADSSAIAAATVLDTGAAVAGRPEKADVDAWLQSVLLEYIDDPAWLSRFFAGAGQRESGTTFQEPAASAEQDVPRTETLSPELPSMDETMILDPAMMRSANEKLIQARASAQSTPAQTPVTQSELEETIVLGGESADPGHVPAPVVKKAEPTLEPGLDETIILHRDGK